MIILLKLIAHLCSIYFLGTGVQSMAMHHGGTAAAAAAASPSLSQSLSQFVQGLPRCGKWRRIVLRLRRRRRRRLWRLWRLWRHSSVGIIQLWEGLLNFFEKKWDCKTLPHKPTITTSTMVARTS